VPYRPNCTDIRYRHGQTVLLLSAVVVVVAGVLVDVAGVHVADVHVAGAHVADDDGHGDVHGDDAADIVHLNAGAVVGVATT